MTAAMWLSVAPLILSAGRGAGFVLVADVNGDHRPDIIVANAEDGTLSVLLNDGGRRFHPAPGSPFAAGHLPNDIAVADMNGDGHPDLVIANHQSPYVTVLLGDGSGGFRPAPNSPYATGSYPHPHGVAVADFTGDGRPDVVVDSWGNNRIALLEGSGAGELVGTRQLFQVGRRPYERLRSADFNEDGHPDIVTTNLDDGTVSILLGDGKGGFREAQGSPVRAGASPWQVAVADVNGDGHADLIVIPYDRDVRDRSKVAVSVLLGDGGGRFKAGPTLPLDGCAGPNTVAVGDIDGDGHRDIVVGCAVDARLAVFRSRGDGTFSRSLVPDGTGPTWGGVALSDLDGDGTDDIVISNSREGNVRVYFGAGEPAWLGNTVRR